MSEVVKRVLIHGRVQGVCYRTWTVETANQYQLDGWVRNRSDGTVEALIKGDETVVNQLIDACYKGPPAASVTHIETWNAEDQVGKGFEELPTL